MATSHQTSAPERRNRVASLSLQLPLALLSLAQVSFDSVPAGPWCGVIGKGVSVSVDGVDVGIKAVFGIGELGSGNCSFATSYNTQPAFAIVKVLSVGSSGVNGTVIFQLTDNALSVSGVISGLAKNTAHGMHVHAFGDVRDVEKAMSVWRPLFVSRAGSRSSSTTHPGTLVISATLWLMPTALPFSTFLCRMTLHLTLLSPCLQQRALRLVARS